MGLPQHRNPASGLASPLTLSQSDNDFWLSTRSVAGDTIAVMADATPPIASGDAVDTIEELIFGGEWAQVGGGPVYVASGPNGQPVLQFDPAGALFDVLTLGSPCTITMVGRVDGGDSIGYLLQHGVGGATRVPWETETSGGAVGQGLYDGSAHKAFGSAGVEFGDYAVFQVVYGDDNKVRFYQDGVEIGTPGGVTYTTWGGSSATTYVGQNTPLVSFSDLAYHDRELTPAELAGLVAYMRKRNNLPVAPVQCSDLAGLTRIEFAVENLADHYAPGVAIAHWQDSGPNAIRWDTSGTARPTLATDGELGHCVRLDGIDDTFVASGLNLDFSDGVTVFVVADWKTPTLYEGPLYGRATAAAATAHALELYSGAAANSKVMAANRDIAVLALSSTDARHEDLHIMTSRFEALSADERNVRVNSYPSASVGPTGAGSIVPATAVNVLGLAGYNNTKFAGDIYAIVVYYGGTMTDAQCLAVEAELNARYPIYEYGVELPTFSGLSQLDWAIETVVEEFVTTEPVDSWVDRVQGVDMVAAGTARPSLAAVDSVNRGLVLDGVDDTLVATGLNLDFSGGMTVFTVTDSGTRVSFEGAFYAKTTAAAHTAHGFDIYSAGSDNARTWTVNRDTTVAGGTSTDLRYEDTVGSRTKVQTVRCENLVPDEQQMRLDGRNAYSMAGVGAGNFAPDNVMNHVGIAGFNNTKFSGSVQHIAAYYGRAMTVPEIEQVEAVLRRMYVLQPPELAGLTMLDYEATQADAEAGTLYINEVPDNQSIAPLANTGTARPIAATATRGAAIRYDGVDDVLHSAVGINLDMSGGLTIFLVKDTISQGLYEGWLSGHDATLSATVRPFDLYSAVASGIPMRIRMNSDGSSHYFDWNDAAAGANATPQIIAIRVDATLSPDEKVVRLNGADATSVSSVTVPVPPTNPIYRLSTWGYNNTKVNGDLYRMLVYYGRQMTDAETARVEKTLNRIYGVY